MNNSDQQLCDSLVRILSKTDLETKKVERSIGCAVQLDDHHVLTCSHVLQSSIGKTEQLKEGMLFPSFFPHSETSNDKPLLELVAFHSEQKGLVGADDFDDIALLKIQGDLQESDICISNPEKHNEFEQDFIVKSTVGSDMSQAVCVGVSGEGWLKLKFTDKEQVVEKGDSGSAVWNNNRKAITGMIVARKQDKGLCYAIPMYKIMQAFSDYLRPKLVPAPDFLADDLSYLNEIKQDIVSDLQQSDVFREQVRYWCDLGDYNEESITNYLISQCESDDFVELISLLRSAFDRASLKLDVDDTREQKRLMQAARGIVSKLVIFTIKQEAVLRIKKSDRQKARLLPKMSGSVAAGVAARTLGTRIEYMKHKKGCFEGDSYLSLESGFSDKEKQSGVNTSTLLLKKLGEKLVPHIKCDMANEVERTDFINRINAKIQRAKNNKDPKFQRKYFFILPLNTETLSENHKNIFDQLSEMVRDVNFFYITSKYAHDVLTVDDYEIDEALIEYFSTLNEFSEQ